MPASAPAQPGPGLHRARQRLLAIGSIDQRMLILVDIEKLMTSSEMELVEQTLQ